MERPGASEYMRGGWMEGAQMWWEEGHGARCAVNNEHSPRRDNALDDGLEVDRAPHLVVAILALASCGMEIDVLRCLEECAEALRTRREVVGDLDWVVRSRRV